MNACMPHCKYFRQNPHMKGGESCQSVIDYFLYFEDNYRVCDVYTN